MKQLERTKRNAFKLFKKEISNSLGGRIKFTKLFPKTNERLVLYEALLYERNIYGGEKNQAILNKYYALIN